MALIDATLTTSHGELIEEHFPHRVQVRRLYLLLRKEQQDDLTRERSALTRWCYQNFGQQAIGPILNREEATHREGPPRGWLNYDLARVVFDTDAAWALGKRFTWCFKDKTHAAAFKLLAV